MFFRTTTRSSEQRFLAFELMFHDDGDDGGDDVVVLCGFKGVCDDSG